MDLALIDLTANRGDSVLHQSSAISKFFFTLAMIASIIIANRPLELVAIALFLMGGYMLAKISLMEMGHYALYPAVFSLAFAAFQFTVSFTAGMVIILRAVTAALALLLLIFTTPYPEIFGILHRFLPGVLADGLFFTYRIFFILLKEIQNLMINLKLKGGYTPYRLLFNLKNLAGALGVLFIHSFDLSERMYQILAIRGYTGHMRTEREIRFHLQDYLLLALGATAIVLVVIV